MLRFLLALAIALAGFAAPSASAQTSIVAVVNGDPITSYDLNQRIRLRRMTGAGANRSAALDELIDEKVQIGAAKRANIKASSSQIDDGIGKIATRVKLSPAQLKAALGQQGVNIQTLRDRIEAQIAFGRLVRALFKREAKVTEQDLVAALLKNQPDQTEIESAIYELHIVQIALPQNPSDARKRQARRLAERVRGNFTSCSSGLEAARGTRNVVVRDYGRRTEPELRSDEREALKEVAVGRLSAPLERPGRMVMFAVCDKKVVQSTNAAMKALESDLTDKRGEMFVKQYTRRLRRDAVVEIR